MSHSIVKMESSYSLGDHLLPRNGEGSAEFADPTSGGGSSASKSAPLGEHAPSLREPTQEILELRSAKRGSLFYWTWTLKGLVVLILVGLAITFAFFLPYWTVGHGVEVIKVFWHVWVSEKAAFHVGIVLSLFIEFVSLVVVFLIFYRRSAIVPKQCRRLLKALMGGLPQGSMMISYTSRVDATYKVDVPRTIGRLLPCRWLDEDSLLPGIPLKEACVEAAKNCVFGIMFVCRAYIGSEVCRTELKTLAQDGRPNIVLLYPDAAQLVDQFAASGAARKSEQAKTEEGEDVDAVLRIIVEMEQNPGTAGGTVFRISGQEAQALESSPAWMITRFMIQAGTFARVFRTYTPMIFEEWRATALALCGFRNHTWYIGVFFMAAWMVPIVFCAAGAYYSNVTARVLVILFNAIPFVIMCFIFKIMFSGIIGGIGIMPHLNDPVCLLIVLHRLGIVRTVNVRLDGMHTNLFQEIERLGVIATRFDPAERHVYFCQAEKIARGEDNCEGGPQRHLVTWRNNNFDSFHLLPSCVHASWVHKAQGGLDYITMCSIILLFALDHQSLRGKTAGIQLSSKPSSKKKI